MLGVLGFWGGLILSTNYDQKSIFSDFKKLKDPTLPDSN